jgi:hypothetical protein
VEKAMFRVRWIVLILCLSSPGGTQAAFVGYDDRHNFRFVMELILGKGACAAVAVSFECLAHLPTASGAILNVSAGIVAGGFSLQIGPSSLLKGAEAVVKYRELANALQYGGNASLLDRFASVDDILRVCGSPVPETPCAFADADAQGVARVQIVNSIGPPGGGGLALRWFK